MKIIAISIAALILAGAAMPAAAEPAAGAAASQESASAPEQGAAAAKAERKTCRRFDNSARRTQAVTLCLTKQEWKKFEETQDD